MRYTDIGINDLIDRGYLMLPHLCPILRYSVQLHAHRRYIFTDPEKAYNFAKFFKIKAFEFTGRLEAFDLVVA